MNRKKIGYVMVDSRKIFITDPAYLHKWQPGEYRRDVEPDNSYARVTVFSSEHLYGWVELGIVVRCEGGIYPVYITEDDEGMIRKVEVVFDQLGTEEDYDEADDDKVLFGK